jgi:hypothetical protein
VRIRIRRPVPNSGTASANGVVGYHHTGALTDGTAARLLKETATTLHD